MKKIIVYIVLCLVCFHVPYEFGSSSIMWPEFMFLGGTVYCLLTAMYEEFLE